MSNDSSIYESKLRTNQPNKRAGKQLQIQLEIFKRNGDAPQNALPTVAADEVNLTIKKFMSNMCFPDVGNRIINFKSEKVESNKQLIKNWYNELKPDRIKRINFQRRTNLSYKQ